MNSFKSNVQNIKTENSINTFAKKSHELKIEFTFNFIFFTKFSCNVETTQHIIDAVESGLQHGSPKWQKLQPRMPGSGAMLYWYLSVYPS